MFPPRRLKERGEMCRLQGTRDAVFHREVICVQVSDRPKAPWSLCYRIVPEQITRVQIAEGNACDKDSGTAKSTEKKNPHEDGSGKEARK